MHTKEDVKINKFINSPLCYTGNKFKLLPELLPEFDYTKKYFVDLFAGGGSVFSNIIDKFDCVLVNDIITDLIGIHKGLIESDEIIEKVKLLCPAKDDQEAFVKLRENYNNNKTSEGLFALLLSSTNNMLRYSQSMNYNQTFGKRTINSSTLKKIEEYTTHLRPYKNKIIFVSKEFYKVKITKPAMVYMDMPYGYYKTDYNINDNNFDKQIAKKQLSEAGYNNFWYREHEIKLYHYCNELNNNGSSFILSGVLHHNGKTSWILDKLIADGYKYKELNCDYNKVSRKGNKETTEIIIKNY